jgi:hypothetical protein
MSREEFIKSDEYLTTHVELEVKSGRKISEIRSALSAILLQWRDELLSFSDQRIADLEAQLKEKEEELSLHKMAATNPTVKLSICPTCNEVVRASAWSLMSEEQKEEVEAEAAKHNLIIEEVPLSECKRMKWCRCK